MSRGNIQGPKRVGAPLRRIAYVRASLVDGELRGFEFVGSEVAPLSFVALASYVSCCLVNMSVFYIISECVSLKVRPIIACVILHAWALVFSGWNVAGIC